VLRWRARHRDDHPAGLSDVTEADEYLRGRDPVLRRLIDSGGPIDPETDRRGSRPDAYEAIARAIVGQQLSTKAAASIWGKLVDAFGGSMPEPGELLAADDDVLRGAGLSRAKVGFLRDLATRIAEGELDLTQLPELSDEDVIADLIQIHGVGRWTAEMFLISQLGRLDVWPVDDYGVRKGYSAIFGGELLTAKELVARGDAFRPYRTIAAWYCWRAADTVLPDSA
jgi:3-methyladenine DNA glycosylase/8-oxoguanine DNA glycosylase